METTINRSMIVLARESRGMNQLELANRIGMSQQNLGKIENGDIGIKEGVLEQIANVTSYPPSLFTIDYEIYPEHLVYRKRDKVSIGLLTPINGKVNIIRFHVENLMKKLNVHNAELPLFEVSEKDTPQIIAQKVRAEWEITSPVISNIVKLLEDHCIAIACFDFGTERVDSRCIMTSAKQPVIIFNKTLLGDRQRFSLAYQLGHLLMHTGSQVNWERDIAHEANLFAAEFLMPENEIRKDFENGVTLPLLAHLKTKWKASMISLLYRADDLGFLTPNQKRYLIQQFNEQKLRRREPIELDIEVENTALIRRWISEVKAKQKLDTNGMASLLHLNTDEFIEIYG